MGNFGQGWPEIVTLCGSTRFRAEYESEMERLTLGRKIVVGVGLYGYGRTPPLDAATKAMLDDVHLWKIDLADRVHIINPGGYVGESTTAEIAYARMANKRITYMVEPGQLPGAETSGEKAL